MLLGLYIIYANVDNIVIAVCISLGLSLLGHVLILQLLRWGDDSGGALECAWNELYELVVFKRNIWNLTHFISIKVSIDAPDRRNNKR